MAIKSAVKQAKQAGMQRATQDLRSQGYPEADIERLRQYIVKCSVRDKLTNCLKNLKSQLRQSNRSVSKNDAENLRMTVQAARAAGAQRYYELIEALNNSATVSLAGSKLAVREPISGNGYATTIKMAPNSVLLFELSVRK